MHVPVVTFDFNWIVQVFLTAFFIFIGLLRLVKNTATKYFQFDGYFDSKGGPVSLATDKSLWVPGVSEGETTCVICGVNARSQCSGCKIIRYCSPACQKVHWRSGHSKKCRELFLDVKKSEAFNYGKKSFGNSIKNKLVIANRGAQNSELPKKIIFPYDVFVEHFNARKPGFPPCGLLNCGNSCFANVVLQCLTFTPPLVSYLLGEGHRRQCKRNDWCFLCELQTHVNRASRSIHPFSPLSILSRLPNIGSNFGNGKQEDAHEFMRFAIDAMQSVCLDEFGGEKAMHHSAHETSLIQYTFGGHLQSQIICSECNNVSNQNENMMDLTVEIQGDVASLEDCLNQFTAREWLHGENMYKCDGCNAYVKASKCLTVHRAPNILTIALKRFQSGRFGKLNKRVSFPDSLDLSPYMSEPGDGTDIYNLYAVVVHMDMLNASFFGHYICYIKDFRENWYRVDDDKVRIVDLEEVLSQSAYMLLYTRSRARPFCLSDIESSCNAKHQILKKARSIQHCSEPLVENVSSGETKGSIGTNFSELPSSNSDVPLSYSISEEGSPSQTKFSEYAPITDFDIPAFENLIQSCEEDEVVSHRSTVKLMPDQISIFEKGAKCWNESSPASKDFIRNFEEDEVVSYCSKQLVPTQITENSSKACDGSFDSRNSAESCEVRENLGRSLSESAVKIKPLFSRGFLAKRVSSNNAVGMKNDCNGASNGSISTDSLQIVNFEEHGNSCEAGSKFFDESSLRNLPESGGIEDSGGSLVSSSLESDMDIKPKFNFDKKINDSFNTQDAPFQNQCSENAPVSNGSNSKGHFLPQFSVFESGGKLCKRTSGLGDSPPEIWDSSSDKNLKIKPLFSRGFLANSEGKTKNRRSGNSFGTSSSKLPSEDICLNFSSSEEHGNPPDEMVSDRNGVFENHRDCFDGFSISNSGELPESGEELGSDIKLKPLFSCGFLKKESGISNAIKAKNGCNGYDLSYIDEKL